MTCIVGLRHGKDVLVGGDSSGIAGWELTIRKDPKVFISGRYAIGFTTSFRIGQLLQHKLKLPAPPKTDSDLYAFMVNEFVEATRECLKAGGVASKDKEVEQGGTFIVAVSGRLFVVESDYQVVESALPFVAIGSGSSYALGSLATSKGEPVARVEKALAVAEQFSIGVRGPFHVVNCPT